MGIDIASTIANSVCAYITLSGDPDSLNRLYTQYDTVTNDDLKRITAKYFVPSGLTISTISADEQGGVK